MKVYYSLVLLGFGPVDVSSAAAACEMPRACSMESLDALIQSMSIRGRVKPNKKLDHKRAPIDHNRPTEKPTRPPKHVASRQRTNPSAGIAYSSPRRGASAARGEGHFKRLWSEVTRFNGKAPLAEKLVALLRMGSFLSDILARPNLLFRTPSSLFELNPDPVNVIANRRRQMIRNIQDSSGDILSRNEGKEFAWILDQMKSLDFDQESFMQLVNQYVRGDRSLSQQRATDLVSIAIQIVEEKIRHYNVLYHSVSSSPRITAVSLLTSKSVGDVQDRIMASGGDELQAKIQIAIEYVSEIVSQVPVNVDVLSPLHDLFEEKKLLFVDVDEVIRRITSLVDMPDQFCPKRPARFNPDNWDEQVRW
jgi:hypothetical protein